MLLVKFIYFSLNWQLAIVASTSEERNAEPEVPL